MNCENVPTTITTPYALTEMWHKVRVVSKGAMMPQDDTHRAYAIAHLAEAIRLLTDGWITDDPRSPQEFIDEALVHLAEIKQPMKPAGMWTDAGMLPGFKRKKRRSSPGMHPRAKAGREPYALAYDNHVLIMKGDGGFCGAEIRYHDLFDHEELAYWINEGLDRKFGKS